MIAFTTCPRCGLDIQLDDKSLVVFLDDNDDIALELACWRCSFNALIQPEVADELERVLEGWFEARALEDQGWAELEAEVARREAEAATDAAHDDNDTEDVVHDFDNDNVTKTTVPS